MANPLMGLLVALGLSSTALHGESSKNQCFAKIDIDAYLFDRYLETPKFDSTGDFTSKDPKAAALLDMTLRQYVIGGLDKNFKQTLYVAFNLMEELGLNPGITAAFRDDYRQQLITKGIRARVGNSYHGGSKRGGYGHGLAVDIVSLNGNTRAEQEVASEKLWQWIDKAGRAFGIARPYGNHDPPHIVPITSSEYRTDTRVAHAAKRKQRTRLAHKNQTARG